MRLRAVAIRFVALACSLAGAACAGDDASTSSSSSSGTSGTSSCPDDLPAACPSSPPSYAKDVAAVFQTACTPCHAVGGAESNRLLTDYADVNRQKSAVLNQVHACKMPPSGAPPLSAEGRAVLQAWLVCGAPNN